MSGLSVLIAAWLLVIGYGLIYLSYKNLSGQQVSFQQAFFGSGGIGLFSHRPAPATGPAASLVGAPT